MTICNHNDLPEGMKKRQRLAHALAESEFENTWNNSCVELLKFGHEMTGNDILSYFGTLIAAFTSRWLIEMTKIADRDDAGISKDDLIKDTLNGIIAMLGGKAEFTQENNNTPGGIKRLKK